MSLTLRAFGPTDRNVLEEGFGWKDRRMGVPSQVFKWGLLVAAVPFYR